MKDCCPSETIVCPAMPRGSMRYLPGCSEAISRPERCVCSKSTPVVVVTVTARTSRVLAFVKVSRARFRMVSASGGWAYVAIPDAIPKTMQGMLRYTPLSVGQSEIVTNYGELLNRARHPELLVHGRTVKMNDVARSDRIRDRP